MEVKVRDRPIAALFDPASVAVVGASDDTRKWGNWLAQGALRGEAQRPAYLVNHRSPTILGRRAYASLQELPEAPELVVIAVPGPAIAPTVDAALSVGAQAVVVISAGAGGAQRDDHDAALARRVRDAGAVLLGPNCLGVLDSGCRLELVPNPLPAGAIGLISQSGNLALELGLMAAPEGLGFSRFASLGNQAIWAPPSWSTPSPPTTPPRSSPSTSRTSATGVPSRGPRRAPWPRAPR